AKNRTRFHCFSLLLRRRRRSGRGRSRRSRSRGSRRAAGPPVANGLFGALARRRVALEDPRHREFSELVPDHVLGHVHRDVLLAVMHGDREADEIGHDRRAARPGLDRTLVVGAACRADLGREVVVDERALLDGTRHILAFHPARRRSRTIITCVRLLRRVLKPLLCTPHGDTGGCADAVRPSPPPCGWSIGFMATPRTVGRTPRQRLRPALPMDSRLCSELPTSPIVARQSMCTLRISPERNLSCAYEPSRASTCTPAPAERASCAPLPGIIS